MASNQVQLDEVDGTPIITSDQHADDVFSNPILPGLVIPQDDEANPVSPSLVIPQDDEANPASPSLVIPQDDVANSVSPSLVIPQNDDVANSVSPSLVIPQNDDVANSVLPSLVIPQDDDVLVNPILEKSGGRDGGKVPMKAIEQGRSLVGVQTTKLRVRFSFRSKRLEFILELDPMCKIREVKSQVMRQCGAAKFTERDLVLIYMDNELADRDCIGDLYTDITRTILVIVEDQEPDENQPNDEERKIITINGPKDVRRLEGSVKKSIRVRRWHSAETVVDLPPSTPTPVDTPPMDSPNLENMVSDVERLAAYQHAIVKRMMSRHGQRRRKNTKLRLWSTHRTRTVEVHGSPRQETKIGQGCPKILPDSGASSDRSSAELSSAELSSPERSSPEQ